MYVSLHLMYRPTPILMVLRQSSQHTIPTTRTFCIIFIYFCWIYYLLCFETRAAYLWKIKVVTLFLHHFRNILHSLIFCEQVEVARNEAVTAGAETADSIHFRFPLSAPYFLSPPTTHIKLLCLVTTEN